MITVRDIDRLVLSDDAVAARIWPRLGPKVRDAYLHGRDAWVVLRRTVEAGGTLPVATLAGQQKVFSGWARAFRAAAAGRTKRPLPARVARRLGDPESPTAAAAAPPAHATVLSPSPALPPLMAPGAGAITKAGGGAGTAVAGGLVLAGLIAVAARSKRA